MKIKNLKKIKKFMAMFLCVLMVMNVAVPALATVITASDTNAEEPTEHIVLNLDEDVNPCGTCGNIPCECEPAEVCGTCGKEPCECPPVEVCADCGKEPCECVSEEVCAGCGKEPCECEPVEVCADCGKEPCECEPVEVCVDCGNEPCECAPTEVCANCGKEPCECMPVEVCADCGKEPCECESDEVCADCGKETCECVVCETCGEKNCEGHEEKVVEASPSDATCPDCGESPCICEVCEECGEKNCEGHAPKLTLGGVDAPEVGDIIWIKSGSIVYKSYTDTKKNYHELLGNYEIEIVNILTNEDGAAEWYEFKFNNLGFGEVILSLGGYKYVHVDNTSIENPDSTPVDPHACTCGQYAPENLADHTDSCPRKQYVKSLFEGKTAEEIYAEWDSYDEATQEDILDMVQRYDADEYEKLNVLVKCTCDMPDGKHEIGCPLYAGTPFDSIVTEDGNTVVAVGIPENGSIKITDPDQEVVEIVEEDVESYFGAMRTSRTPNKVRGLFTYDISILDKDGSEWQPGENNVEIMLTIPEFCLGVYEKIYIGHMHDGKVEIQEANYDFEKGTITFETNGFSVFYGFIVDFEYNGLKFSMEGGSEVLLSEVLEALEINQETESVESVEFSDESLIEIEKEENDWKLKSLRAFGTDEWLVITFNDGTIIEIKVTDPVLYYYLNGSGWCMNTFTSGITAHAGYVAPEGNVVINEEAITGAHLGDTHENTDNETVYDVIIYCRPGMAIRFNRYSSFAGVEQMNSSTKESKDGLWRWVWGTDSYQNGDTTGYNYVVISNNVSTVTETVFSVRIGNVEDKSTDYKACDIKIVIVPDAPAPTLMKDVLMDEDTPDKIKNTYSIKEVPVTLYDYDGNALKEAYKSGGDFFSFRGVSKGDNVTVDNGNLTDKGEANGGGPIMGILKSTLVGDEKLPEMAQGQQVDLFSSTPTSYKTVRNVQFEFIYDAEGYYTYSSNINHAQLSDDGTKVQLYREAMGTTASYALNGADTNYAAGGFYPYSDIRLAADSGGTILDWNTWEERLAEGYVKEAAPFGRDLVSSAMKAGDLYSKSTLVSTVDMHNGLQLAVNFYLPKDKRTPNGNEIVYQFTGDDDLWVFIDDQLVLDIGGGHGPASGSINFTTGEVKLEGDYYTIGSSTKYTNYESSKTFEGDKVHSLKVFYLERYGGVSNCRMRFNVPIIPDGTVLISKELLNENNKNEFAVATNEDYTFTVYTAEDTDDTVDKEDSAFKPLANTDYVIVGSGSGGTTDANGTFQLKAGETAQFEGITHFTEVYVVESKPNDGYKYKDSPTLTIDQVSKTVTVVNGGNSYRSPSICMPDGTTSFVFTNYMEVSDLTVSKSLVDDYDAVDDETSYEVQIELAGEPYSGLAELNGTQMNVSEGKFNLKAGESLVIKNIPTNMKYSILESTPTQISGYEYKAPFYNNSTEAPTNVVLAKDEVIEIINEIIALYGKLVISKSGINSVDHHKKDGQNEKEIQSTMYTVSGTSVSGEAVSVDVVIVGNGKVTITTLPVGSYTVAEKNVWSWRYDPTVNNQIAVVEGNKTANVEFVNERRRSKWLSGDSHSSNWWGENNGTTVGRREYDFSSISNNS